MSAKLVAIFLILIILGTSVALISRITKAAEPSLNLDFSHVGQKISQFLSSLQPIENELDLPVPSPQAPNAPSPTPTTPPQEKPTQTNQTTPSRPCYRFTIPNGSPKCYSQADYNQLVNLGYELSSAQTFYHFHLDGVARYQAEYDQTGSSIYLDAKASSQAQADQEKAKIDQTLTAMYTVEGRGY